MERLIWMNPETSLFVPQMHSSTDDIDKGSIIMLFTALLVIVYSIHKEHAFMHDVMHRVGMLFIFAQEACDTVYFFVLGRIRPFHFSLSSCGRSGREESILPRVRYH